MKNLLASNLSNTAEEVTSNVTRELREMAGEIREVKNLFASNLSNTVDEVTSNVTRELNEIKNLLASMQERNGNFNP